MKEITKGAKALNDEGMIHLHIKARNDEMPKAVMADFGLLEQIVVKRFENLKRFHKRVAA